MANITIKRNLGGSPVTYENLYPRTIISQLFDTDGTTTLFDGGKLKPIYLPSSIIGGMRFAGSFSITGSPSGPLNLPTFITGTATSGYTITANLDSISGITHPAYTADQGNSYIGYYWIATGAVQVEDDITGVADWRTTATFDDGVVPADSGGGIVTAGLNLEAGDWLIITGFDSTNKIFFFSVINNTYADASTTAKGVVTLSSSTSTATTGSAVVTNGVLNGLIGTTATTIAAGNHLHTGVYQPIDGDLTAIAGLAGTSGFLKKTAADTYTLDTNTYLTSQSVDFGVVTVSDTDSGHTYASSGSATADANGDTLTLVDGDGIDLDVSTTTDAIRIQHTDTSTLTGAQGSAGIASITVDGFGHVTAVTTATYNNYSLPLAADGTRGGIQIGATQTETNRAVILTSEKASVSLPRQIPAVTLNGASSTSPSFYAPTSAGLTGSASQAKQSLIATTGAAPVWVDSPHIYYDTVTGSTLGDIILDVE